MTFEIVFTPRAREHLRLLPVRTQRTIVDQITVQLSHRPDVPTRKRQPLRPNRLAGWELRIANWPVFYDIHREISRVDIVAVGVKQHNRLFIAGKEFLL